MTITAALVKQLRERTGAGMMDCKKVLQETDGDIELAVEELRKKGAAQADKKASRVAAEGTVVTLVDGDNGVLLEVNSETDFVAKDENFIQFAQSVAATILRQSRQDLPSLMASQLDSSDKTVEVARQELIAKIGENIDVRRFHIFNVTDNQQIASYQHGQKIGVLVVLDGASGELGKDMAMHIAAARPLCVAVDNVPQDVLDKEREIFAAQAADSGKPEAIMQKMVDGRLKKYVNEIALEGQDFVKDPDQKVAKLLQAANAKVVDFVRFEVGEGIDKKEDDFVGEVMAQAGKA